MELAPDGEARFYRPDGRALLEAPALPVAAREPVTVLAARLASHGVTVDAHATLPDWWGGPVHYAWGIEWVRYRDRRVPGPAAEWRAARAAPSSRRCKPTPASPPSTLPPPTPR